MYSKVKRNKTETYLVPYGNAHTCNALIDYAYENCPHPSETEDGLDLELDEGDE